MIESTETFPAVIPSAPEPNSSVAQYRPKGEETNGGKLILTLLVERQADNLV